MNQLDTSPITNPEAMHFIEGFFSHRAINREFYERLTDEQFDFRMVDTPERKSDSPRESLTHQISVQRNYLDSLKFGTLSFESEDENPAKLSKSELLKKLNDLDTELVELLS